MYGKSYRQETHATDAIVKLINLKDKDYGVDLNQFLSIITLHLGPFVVFQQEFRKQILDKKFWKATRTRNGDLVSQLSFLEARKMVCSIYSPFYPY
jgi:hypothetical protein